MSLPYPTHAPQRNILPRLLVRSLACAAVLAGTLSASAHAAPGKNGWQGRIDFPVATGQVDLFVHYPCPAAFPVARSGGMFPNLAAKPGMVILGSAPRIDEVPSSYAEWGWIIDWPSGAPAGSVLSFDVYCTKGPA